MNPLSVLKIGMVDRKSQKQDNAEPKFRPISLLSVLEAENIRLRQSVVELLLDTLVLREALKDVTPAAKSRI